MNYWQNRQAAHTCRICSLRNTAAGWKVVSRRWIERYGEEEWADAANYLTGIPKEEITKAQARRLILEKCRKNKEELKAYKIHASVLLLFCHNLDTRLGNQYHILYLR